MSLSSLIVQREVATMRQVEEALARQVIYGGDLVTNLLEVARVDEAVLTPLLAESMHLAAAPPGELAPPPEAVRALIPAEVAVQQSIVPLESDGAQLLLAVVEPLPAEVRDQLAFALGMRIEEVAAPAVRVWQAVARAYGVQLDRRMHRLIGRLSGDASFAGSLPPLRTSLPPAALVTAPLVPAAISDLFAEAGAPGAPPPAEATVDVTPAPVPAAPPARTRSSRPPPREPSVRPVGALTAGPTRAKPSRRATLTSFPSVRAGTDAAPAVAPRRSSRPEMAVAVQPAPLSVDGDRHALLQRDVSINHRAGRRRRGPLTLDDARAEAEEATHRDVLLDLFFDFSRQFFDYAVLFLVQADIAEGRDAFGSGASRDRVLGIGVPLDLPSLLATAREKRAPVVAVAATDGLDAVLLADLHRPRESEIAVIPLLVRNRAVALLVGDCGDAGIDRDTVRQVVGFGVVVGKAFERIIVRRKLDGFIAGSAHESSERRGSLGGMDAVSVPSKSVPPVAPLPSPPLPMTAGAVRPGATRPSMPAAVPLSTPPWVSTSVVARASVPAVPAQPRPEVVSGESAPVTPGSPAVRPSSAPPPPANIAVLRPIGGPPIPREEPDSPPSPGIEAAKPFLPASEAPELDGPEIEAKPSEGDEEDDATVLFDAFAREITGGRPESEAGIPSSAIAVPAHLPPAAQAGTENGLPLVIVDLAVELGALVDRLVAGDHDEAAEMELLRQGARAMPVLMVRFPGPLTFERSLIATTPNPPRASECGVVLRLVARERRVALPFVLERLDDPNPERRGWATHLLGELPYVEALPRLIDRLNDDDAAIRVSAAMAIAAVARSHPGRVVQTLRELADEVDPRRRQAAMRAASEVRDPQLVPLFTRGLGDGAEEVVQAAHAGLVQVTRQDFGLDARPWQRWWDQNASRHRLEWLIDALTHDVSEVRRAAGDELRLLSRQYFGFSSDLPPRDRERAQQRYRDWWITEGRGLHRRA
jgi:hypothetical protein